jgi:hypothetical protein
MNNYQLTNKNKLNYYPTNEDLGMTDKEVDEFQVKFPSKWLNLVDIWIERNNERITKRDIQKRNEFSASHWYKTTDKDTLIKAIIKSTKNHEQVIDFIARTQTRESLIRYYERLKDRIKNGQPVITSCEVEKLKRFPKYDEYRKEIFGSNARLVTLWSHVYSLKNK